MEHNSTQAGAILTINDVERATALDVHQLHEMQGFENTEQFINFEADRMSYLSARAWAASFPARAPFQFELPSMGVLCNDPANPLQPPTFMGRLTAWAHKFESWLISEGYNPRDPLEKPDKRKKRVHSASVVSTVEAPKVDRRFKQRDMGAAAEAERLRALVDAAVFEREQQKHRYSSAIHKAQQAMMDIVTERNKVLPVLEENVRKLKEEHRKAKAAI